MRKKMIWGAILPGCLVLAFACLMLTISGITLANPPDGDGNHNHGGGGGGGGDTIPVTVTFRDFLGDDDDPVPDRIQSDDGETYDSASIGRTGKFGLGIGGKQKPNEPAVRMLWLDFSDCVSGPCTSPLPPVGLFAASPGTVILGTHGIDLTEMPVDEFLGVDAGMNLNIDLTKTGGGYWTLRWALDFENCPAGVSSAVTVTRTAAGIWEIEAFPNDLACLGEFVGGEWEFRGLYHMPFKMTLQVIPD